MNEQDLVAYLKDLDVDVSLDRIEDVITLIKQWSKSPFTIAYNVDGKVNMVIPGKICKQIDTSKWPAGKIPLDILVEGDKEYIEVRTIEIVHNHASPGCYIVDPWGNRICVCCQ